MLRYNRWKKHGGHSRPSFPFLSFEMSNNKFLMQEHHLTSSDLPKIENQETISELLEGKRELNVKDIRALSERFGLSPATFF